MTISNKPLRSIRSYVLRQGRISPAQKEAHNRYWQEFGVNLEMCADSVDWVSLFGRTAPLVLEIGFGMGDLLITLAKAHPEKDFIGIEVHTKGVGRCLLQAKSHQLSNLKLFNEDALKVLACIPDHSLDKIFLLFPDPWPKKKHHKRRIVQSAFVALIAQKLKQGGIFHLATDWQNYADHMLAVLEESSSFTNVFGKANFAPSQFERPATKYEIRGKKLKHAIWELVYCRHLV